MLSDAYEAVTDGTGWLFTLLGPAGVGKSRLIREFLTSIGDSATVLRGRCLPYGQGITYWPIAEIVHSAAGIVPADSQDDAVAKLLALCPEAPDGEFIAHRVAQAIGLSSAAAAQEELFLAIRRLLALIALQKPLIVVLDDIQWAEATLLDLVGHIVDRSRSTPLMLLCLARPELLDLRPTWGGGVANGNTLLLEPLGRDESLELIGGLPGGNAVPTTVRRRIMDAAEGNPLFVEEMVAVLVDEGVIVADEGEWRLTRDPDHIRVPATIYALLAARLDGLAPSEVAVAQRASVVGRTFEIEAVVALSSESDRMDVRTGLLALSRKDLVRPDESTGDADVTYSFRHLLIRDAAYDSLTKAQRADLHVRLANWLEGRVGDRADEYDEIIGSHLARAVRYRVDLLQDDPERDSLAVRASTHLADAGARALSTGDVRAAVKLLSEARELVPQGETLSPPSLLNLGRAFALSDESEWPDVLASAITAATAQGDTVTEWRARVLQVYYEGSAAPAGWTDRARQVAERAIEALEPLRDDWGLYRAWDLIAGAAEIGGELRRAGVASEHAAAYASRTGNRLEVALERVDIASLAAEGEPSMSAAEAAFREILRAFPDSPLVQSRALSGLGWVLGATGDTVEATAVIARARAIAQELGRPDDVSVTTQGGGWIAYYAGDFDAAERHWRQAYEEAEDMGIRSRLFRLAARRARLLVELDRHEEALTLTSIVERAELEGAVPDPRPRALWRTARARILARRGDLEAASKLIHEARAISEPSEFLELRAMVWSDVAHVLYAAGRTAEAISLLDRAVDTLEKKGMTAPAQIARRTRDAWRKAL